MWGVWMRGFVSAGDGLMGRLAEPQFEPQGVHSVQIVPEQTLVPHKAQVLIQLQRRLVGDLRLQDNLQETCRKTHQRREGGGLRESNDDKNDSTKKTCLGLRQGKRETGKERSRKKKRKRKRRQKSQNN